MSANASADYWVPGNHGFILKDRVFYIKTKTQYIGQKS